ncbi:MAG: MoaD/ThiS family protein [Myxococcales bacterium]|nr:MoaD/ThiS family protein [Myxococcales bacterium]MCB9733069.1 MoaD/ThiS family protein [Deltaproteobacteria bacterium]
MAVKIKIPASLRKFVGGNDVVDVDAGNVGDALDGLESAHPGIKAKLCDDSGNVRRFINIYANSEDIRFLENLKTPLSDGAELQIVPAIAGGWY